MQLQFRPLQQELHYVRPAWEQRSQFSIPVAWLLHGLVLS
jgi:hypothetical protein